MPPPAREEAPASRVDGRVRAGIFFAALVALAGVVLLGLNALGLVMSAIGGLHGFRAADLPPRPVAAVETPAALDASDEQEMAPPPTSSPIDIPELGPTSPSRADAGHDAGQVDAGRRRARLLLDAGVDASPGRPVRSVACNADLAQRVEATYASSSTFRATFDQELVVGALGSVTHSHGSLIVAKPGMMSWSYDDPENSRIVSDGQTVAVYEAPNKHLFRVPAASSPYPGAFAFLTGAAPLTALFDFTVGHVMDGMDPMPDVCVLVGTPIGLTRAYRKVLFYIDQVTVLVRRVMIFDRGGDRNRIDLLDLTMGVPVEPDQFVFVPPADTIVVGR
jgi:outer membrane lipoprotein-sorting protein